MTYSLFEELVLADLVRLDELAKTYAKYRVTISQRFLDELGTKIVARVPGGYSSFAENPQLSAQGAEKICGWARDVEVLGTKSTATVCFGVYLFPLTLVEGWPFMNGGAWTGIRLWLPARARIALLASARNIALETEPRDRNWIAWRHWTPLSAVDLSGLHSRLTGQDRGISQDEIVDELIKWTTDFEEMLHGLNRSAG